MIRLSHIANPGIVPCPLPAPSGPPTLGYSVNRLDRRAEYRDDDAYMAELAASPDARCVVLQGDVPLLRQRGGAAEALFDRTELAELGAVREKAFLGLDEQGPIYAALTGGARARERPGP